MATPAGDGRPRPKAYDLLPGLRGALLVRVGRTDEARAEFVRAAEPTRDERERAMLLDRAARLDRAALLDRSGR